MNSRDEDGRSRRFSAGAFPGPLMKMGPQNTVNVDARHREQRTFRR